MISDYAPNNSTLMKSHPKSKICIRKLSDSMCIFGNNPRLTAYGNEIVILQIMLIGNGDGLIEYVMADDF